ncbi:MAG: hypothetical protein E6J01_03855 [Chloroflexi bacterium]|nr:MAG: hypothetical protein E6J01_03855 [Chloroflexota bacterium]
MNTDLVDDLLAPDRLAIALRILADRAARWVSLCMSFALFAYSAWRLEPWSVACAVCFTVLVQVPLWWQRKER